MLIQIKQIEGLGNALSSKFDVTGGTITGSVSATTYYGDGSNLTGISNTVSLKAEIENNIGITFNNEVFTYDSSNKMTLIEYKDDTTNIYTKNIYYNSSDTVTATTITKISDSSTLNTIFNYNSSGIITGKTYS